MPNSTLGHLQINVAPQNLPFYKDMMGFLGWSMLYEDPNTVGVGDSKGNSLWYVGAAKPVPNDYDGPGTNHIAVAVESQQEVDQMVDFLKERNIPGLFETPRHRPEFSAGAGQTYYQVMFESPDRILYEVVYTGPLAQ
jgi:catechol 2,3-dioxygenase-like lactoylglutathione lyase family enzyme